MKKLFLASLLALCAAVFAEELKVPEPRKETLKRKDKETEVLFYSAFYPPFEITGFPSRKPGSSYLYRLPEWMDFTKMKRRGIKRAAARTTGGTVRFATDSPVVVARSMIKEGACSDASHRPRIANAGFDLYVDCGTPNERAFRPSPHPTPEGAQGKEPILLIADEIAKDGKMREYTVFLPLFSELTELEIGVAPGSRIAAPRPQKIKDPICFYGSSITQGGCASRPANTYCALLCRAVDAPQINLGFAGNAKGEPAIAEAISKLKMSVFVMDYDFNASPSLLAETHEPFFKIVRDAQPDLPIIIISGPRDRNARDAVKRRDIVKATYDHAVAAGDKHVYFVDGLSFFDEIPHKYCTVDGTHPTDLGFHLMYKKVLPVLKQALAESKR